jgi:hypothetical protein
VYTLKSPISTSITNPASLHIQAPTFFVEGGCFIIPKSFWCEAGTRDTKRSQSNYSGFENDFCSFLFIFVERGGINLNIGQFRVA